MQRVCPTLSLLIHTSSSSSPRVGQIVGGCASRGFPQTLRSDFLAALQKLRRLATHTIKCLKQDPPSMAATYKTSSLLVSVALPARLTMTLQREPLANTCAMRNFVPFPPLQTSSNKGAPCARLCTLYSTIVASGVLPIPSVAYHLSTTAKAVLPLSFDFRVAITRGVTLGHWGYRGVLYFGNAVHHPLSTWRTVHLDLGSITMERISWRFHNSRVAGWLASSGSR
ncbi:hypothetical protein EXIGLDRAFT_732965 [Exidia glandulosa HHB12029]|uniref:Uncharacterized protein n=1 Tax=Exidia glandulosa HHB12029 TaxID=1314781 RepID=A0A165PVN1_EXIGL|nr:hypothetical protein EXIGLDRAFT_732965 [Exidia glandulosa HHB12029]